MSSRRCRADQRVCGQCHLRGLMLDARRKSIEPMAQRLGEVHDQALRRLGGQPTRSAV
jgi:hypothetical protein